MPAISTWFKVCCVQDVREARMAIRHGASAIGLVSAMPGGPGPIPEDRIAEIAAAVPPPTATFLLTALQDAPAIIEQQRRCGTNAVQLVDRLETGTYDELRRGLPGVRIVQVVHVRGPESVDEALGVAPEVDALLLDSGDPTRPVKELGGTGRVHDWELSREIRERATVPAILAGGLNPENVAAAIAAVRPSAVDVCSGLRPTGRLDEARLAAFSDAVRRTTVGPVRDPVVRTRAATRTDAPAPEVTGDPAVATEIQAMVDRETRAWDTQNLDLLMSIFHPDMVWPWPARPDHHDPMDWVLAWGRYHPERWREGWGGLFASHELVHNRRETKRIVVSDEGDAAFAVVDVDTLWRGRDGEEQRWRGRACKMYTRMADGWKLIAHTGLLDYG